MKRDESKHAWEHYPQWSVVCDRNDIHSFEQKGRPMIETGLHIQEILDWCDTNIEHNDAAYSYYWDEFYFKNEEDVVGFLLRWA
jgi:hypothetical protein